MFGKQVLHGGKKIFACLLAATLAASVVIPPLAFAVETEDQSTDAKLGVLSPPPNGSYQNWLAPPSGPGYENLKPASTLVPWDGNVDVSWYNTTDTEFHLTTPQQLAGVAAIVNGIMNPGTFIVAGDPNYIVDMNPGTSNANHYGADDFSGKTIFIENDMHMGGIWNPDQQEWTGPNYMPIGGAYCMDGNDVKTHLNSSFDGVIDGQGHMLYNLLCLRYTPPTGWPVNEAYGIVGRLSNNSNLPAPAEDNLVAGVKRIGITGYMQGMRMVGGIVGSVGRPSNGWIIEQCVNYASVFQSDAFGCGGIVGQTGNGNGMVRNCFNAGNLKRTQGWNVAGIAGINGVQMYNCYNYGTVEHLGSGGAANIGTASSGTSVGFSNCYWLSVASPANGIIPYLGGNPTIKNCSAWTKADMTDRTDTTFIDSLNTLGTPGSAEAINQGNVFVKDEYNLNGGYPLLYWQAPGGKLYYKLTVTAPTDGSFATDPVPDPGEDYLLPFGTTVTMSSTAPAGYAFSHYLVNGVKQTKNRIYFDGDKTVSVVFKPQTSLESFHFASIPTLAFTGSQLKPTPNILNGEGNVILNKDSDYTLSYLSNSAVGTATIKAQGVGEYYGQIETEFYITDKSALNLAIAAAQTERSSVLVSLIDGTDVDPTEYWIDDEADQNFTGVLTEVKQVIDDAEATQQAIDIAKDSIVLATVSLIESRQVGSMQPPPSLEPLITAIDTAQYTYDNTLVRINGNNLSYDVFWVTQQLADDLLLAISNAAVVKGSNPSASQIMQAVADLNTAMTIFNDAKQHGVLATVADKDALTKVLSDAEAAKSDTASSTSNGSDIAHTASWVPQTEFQNLNTAVEQAKTALQSANPTHAQIMTALDGVKQATDAFKAAKTTGTRKDDFTSFDAAEVPSSIATRYDTMADIVIGGKVFTKENTNTVVLANGDNFPDALAASGFAGLHKAPIVLTAAKQKALSRQALDVLTQLEPTTVYIMGSADSITAAAATQVANLPSVTTVKRLGGTNRYDTALQIYKEGKAAPSKWSSTAIIANADGDNAFADALSISPYAYAEGAPIFLSSKDNGGITTAAQAELKAGGFTRVLLLGSKNSVPTLVETQLTKLGLTNIVRLAGNVGNNYGDNRYGTSSAIVHFAVSDSASLNYNHLVIATGEKYADALAGGAYAGSIGTAMLLVNDNSASVDNVIKAKKDYIFHVNILGNNKAVSDKLRAKIKAAYS